MVEGGAGGAGGGIVERFVRELLQSADSLLEGFCQRVLQSAPSLVVPHL